MASDKNYLSLWVEYDYGHDGVIFESEAGAKRWLDEQIHAVEGPGGIDGEFAADLFEAGLAGVNIVTVITYDDID